MAVTNQQVLAAIEELKATMAQPVSFSSNEQDAELVLGRIDELQTAFNKVVGMALGDRAEIVNRLERLQNDVRGIEQLVVGIASYKRPTMSDRLAKVRSVVFGS